MQLLGPFPGAATSIIAADVSADGSTMVGNSAGGGVWWGWSWRNGSFTDLGFVQTELTPSTSANAISGDGSVVVGQVSVKVSRDRIVLVPGISSPSGPVEALTLPEGARAADAHDVSEDGSIIVGSASYSDASGYWSYPFVYSQGVYSLLTDLWVPGGNGRANAVSADGKVVVGYVEMENGLSAAYRWTAATGSQFLGLDGPSAIPSNAEGVSGDGSVVVGELYLNGQPTAMIWTEAEGMRRLEEALADMGVDLGGWKLRSALDVSRDGKVVVGVGMDPQGRFQAWRAVLAEPITVTQSGDEADANLENGTCDVNPDLEGDQCTLRAAIETANRTERNIVFEFDEGHGPDITPETPLPAVTASISIRGHLADGQRVVLDGSSLGNGDGLVLSAAEGVRVSGLVIRWFEGFGVRATGGSGHRLTDNLIGYDGSGSLLRRNVGGGVRIENGVNDVTIGGLEESQENQISGGISIVGTGIRGVRVLRNRMEVPPEHLETASQKVPLDLGGDGPTCSPWSQDPESQAPNRGMAPPRILRLTTATVEGITRPGATVVAYRVVQQGTELGRYWAREVVPIGHATADGAGVFVISAALNAGTVVAVTSTDADGNTSELSQLRRPLIFVPGIGGTWLESSVNGDNLWIPTTLDAPARNDRLFRLRMDETGESFEPIHTDGILEFGGEKVYGPSLEFFQDSGYPGDQENDNPDDLDLWRFPNDWRQSTADLAGELKALVDRLTGGGTDVARSCEVDIVAHSNGGLIASVYVKRHAQESQNKVHRYLTVGTPYLGTPQAIGAHTNGYIFDIEHSLPFEVDWGRMLLMERNVPGAYGLLPSRAYWEATRWGSDGMPQEFLLTDLEGERLESYDATFSFLTRAKRDAEGFPWGLNRNAAIWTTQQDEVHALIDDWRTWQNPPQVFRIAGLLPASTSNGWYLGAGPLSLGSHQTRRSEAGDTGRHRGFRERLTPVLGHGDGTVSITSATLGRWAVNGATDFSGVTESPWIEEFEYFPCRHSPLMESDCATGSGIQSLDRMLEIFRSGYQVTESSAGKRGAGPADLAAGTREIVYVSASAPIGVSIADEAGRRTGPASAEARLLIEYGLPDVTYWAGEYSAALSVPTDSAYTLEVESASDTALVRVIRMKVTGEAREHILFADQPLSTDGALRLALPAGGAGAGVGFEVDADGDGLFEASLEPAAALSSASALPAVPWSTPAVIDTTAAPGTQDLVVALRLPDVGAAGWSYTLSGADPWITLGSTSGAAPAELSLTLEPSTLVEGLYRDTLRLTLAYGAYEVEQPLPVQLAVREQAAVLTRIAVSPERIQLAPGATQQFTATGVDQIGAAMAAAVTWTASGGTVDETGFFRAGAETGTFTLTATGPGGLAGTATVEVTTAVGVDQDELAPSEFRLYTAYPNPFSESARIRYDVASRADVRLEVYDVLGRRVAVLAEGSFAPGRYEAVLAGAGLASGMYVCLVQMGGYTEALPVTLVR